MKRGKCSLQNIYTPKSIDYLIIIKKIIIILTFKLFLIISIWYPLFFSSAIL